MNDTNQDTALFEIFQIQNNVIKAHINKHKTVYSFITDCYLCLSRTLEFDDWQRIPEIRRKIYNLYFGDIFSTLINSTRLAFQGCETDSYALLRVVNQELGEFKSVIESSLYEEMFLELEKNIQNGKNFSTKLQKKLYRPNDKKRNHVYGKLSNLGSHPSPTRMRLSSQKDSNGEVVMKVGMIMNNPNTEDSLIHVSSHYVDAIQVFDKFYVNNLPLNFQSPFSHNKERLENEFQNIINQAINRKK